MLNFETSSEVRAEQLLNIRSMSVTFAVLNFEKSNAFRDLQYSNILLMSVTSSVFGFSIPSMVSRYVQKSNQEAVVVGL